MATLVTAFSIDKKDGAGWVSKRLAKREAFTTVSERRDTFIFKSLWAVQGILFFPFLHPIFTRYTPFLTLIRRGEEESWLNFSQTFALSLMNRNSVLVCHDLQCHCEHRFRLWLRWSERLLLNRGRKIVVLSERDRKIVNRYYRVPLERIENVAPFLMLDLHSFRREIRGVSRRVAFLGTLVRKENREGLAWFVQNVLPGCPDLEVSVIGQISPKHTIEHPQLKYLGFVEDLPSTLALQAFMIAPLFSKAGIKIKVIEALLQEVPVLGTHAAYGGLRRPEGGWCSNDPADWIRILTLGGEFWFQGTSGAPSATPSFRGPIS